MAKIIIEIETGDVLPADIVESFHLAYQGKDSSPEAKEALMHQKVVQFIGDVHHARKVHQAKEQAAAAVVKDEIEPVLKAPVVEAPAEGSPSL